MALNASDIPATCVYVEYGCTSGKAPIGPVIDPATNKVAFVMYSCEDCMAEQAFSDHYKAENGVRPRHMTRAEAIEAYWQLPGVGVRD